MNIKTGLVGLPNVGKSTLFNALTRSSVPAENYPFCTIDPHQAITHVPDPRLDQLQKAFDSQKQIPTSITFVDIAGLVAGAASGEGLGNQFLSHIREVNLILHVLRCFDDGDVVHTRGDIDPIGDYEIIVQELVLKDLESVEKRIIKATSLLKAASNKPIEKKELTAELELLAIIERALNDANVDAVRTAIAQAEVQTIPLLCAKNFFIVANVTERELENDAYKNNIHYLALVNRFGQNHVVAISARLEYELSQLDEDQAEEMMGLAGITERGLNKIIAKSYEELGLITFFTCGPKEIHAWPLLRGTTVRQAAGEIHSDIERGFICAEIFNCGDLIEYGTRTKLKELGKIRQEGQDYIVQNGDIINVRFNV
jgi:ribosome-binding ATPase